MPFSEVSAHRATLEEAYLELTRDAVEYRAEDAGTGAVAMTATMTPERAAAVRDDRDSFGRLVHAEWTKFRTVRGWVIAMVIAAALTAVVGLYAASGPQTGCQPVGPGGPTGPPAPCGRPTRWDRAVRRSPTATTSCTRRCAGNGSITVRVTSLTGRASPPGGGIAPGPNPEQNFTSAIQPWAKAGILVTASTRQGSAYAAMMVTGASRRADAVRLHR